MMERYMIESTDYRMDFVKKYPKLYHYTDLSAFAGIIEKGELWLKSPLIMRDKLECYEFIKAVIEKIKEKAPHIESVKVDEMYKLIVSALKSRRRAIACFSVAEDDASLWERCGNDHKGICIVFNNDTATKLFNYYGLRLFEVQYESKVEAEQYAEILLNNINNKNMLETYANQIADVALCHKNKGYSSEKEIRLIKGYDGGNSYDSTFKETKEQIFQVDALKLRGLCESKSLLYDDIFDSVIIGSRSLQDEDTLHQFLQKNQLHKLSQNIYFSKCSVR